MVYESDFYTTRRPYSRPLVSSYTVTKQDYFPWEKVPFVPRPSLVPEPFTVWGRKQQDPRKEFYQYATLPEKHGVVRGKDAAKQDHTRQLVDGGAVTRIGLDAAAELATRGHVFERGVLARPQIKYRPIILPYSSIIQLRSGPHMPYVAHKRLVYTPYTIVHTPVHHVYYAGTMVPIRVRARVRSSILAAELSRIRDLPRPSSRSYLDEYLNSRGYTLFDDETREIRARVDSLLRRVHVFVPRTVTSDFIDEIVPERMRSHDYVRRLLTGRNNAKKDVLQYLSWYEVPERGCFGNLACVKYVAGKPHSTRRPYFKVADLRPTDIRNDVNFLSYYSKNRQAAATASPGQPMTEREMRKARALDTERPSQEEKTTFKAAPEGELETKPEKISRKKPEPEPIREPEPELAKESEPAREPEPIAEPEPEPAAEPTPVKPPKSAKGTRSARSAKSAKAAEPKAEPAPEPEPAKEPEPVTEPEPAREPEPVVASEPVAELTSAPEPEAEPEATAPIAEDAPGETAEAVSDEAIEEKSEKVRQEKEEAMRRTEEYLAKVAREALTEEERRKAAEEERLQLEMEEEKVWEAVQIAQERKAELSQILENERQEVERKAEEAKLEAEHAEQERLADEERIIKETQLIALIQEQERTIIEEHLEEVHQQKQELEERMEDTVLFPSSEPKDVSCAEDPAFGDITDQEKEEKPYDVTTDDDTKVEEENVAEEEHFELTEDPFVEEPEGAESKPQTGPTAVEDEAQVEEVTSGGEEFEWGDQDA